MNLNNILKTEAEKNDAIEKLKLLINYPGWKLLIDVFINSDINTINNEILDGEIKDINTLNDLKRRRAYYLILKNLPNKIIEILESKDEGIIDDFDPYHQPE